METTAIIFSSKMGKTRKTAGYIAEKLGADIFDLKKQTMINMSEYTHIVFGTGVHAGKPYKPLVEFIENNKEALGKKNISMFICCKFDADKGEEQAKKIGSELGVSDVTFFAGKGEKNEDGFNTDVDSFIDRLRA